MYTHNTEVKVISIPWVIQNEWGFQTSSDNLSLEVVKVGILEDVPFEMYLERWFVISLKDRTDINMSY